MKSNTEKMNSKTILYIVICVLMGIAAILADMFIEIEYEPMKQVFDLVFSAISVIMGIWVTCYLLVLELFKDRYPFNFINKEQMPNMRAIFFMLTYDMILGVIIASIGKFFWGVIWFSVASLSTIIIVFVEVYRANRTIMINSYIDDFFSKITTDYNASKIAEFEKHRRDIWNIFDECVIKEEYFVARNIATKSGMAFRQFLANSIKIAENTDKGTVEEVFKQIVDFNIDQLNLCKNTSSDIMTDVIVREQQRNLNFCITHDRFEWYKIYIHKYSQFVFRMQKEEQSALTETLYAVYHIVLKKLVQEGKTEWIEYTLDQIESLTVTYIFAYDKTNIRNYAILLTEMATTCIDEKKDEFYNLFEKKLSKLIRIRCSEKGVFSEVKLLYFYLFQHLISNDLTKAFAFLEVVMKCRAKCSDDSILVEFKFACIERAVEITKGDVEKQCILLDYQIDAVVEAIGLKKEYDGYYELPDFYGKIMEYEYAKEKYGKILDDIQKLLNHCIIKDNVPSFYTILQDLKKTISKTEQRQKDIQKELVQVYFWLFKRTIYLVNQQFFEIALDQFREAILELDKNRQISAGFGKYIIENVAQCTNIVDRETETHKLVATKIDLLFSFMAEGTDFNFVLANADHKKLIARCLFNIGTECIENGFEEGVRKVSNATGWLIIYSIRQGTGDLTRYLIGRASELFYIAKKMEVSQKTQMFMLTLFTTVGAYCCKDPQYYRYINGIIDGIISEDIERVNVAVSLRTSENDMWNELYDNKTKVLTDDFVSRFIKKKNGK